MDADVHPDERDDLGVLRPGMGSSVLTQPPPPRLNTSASMPRSPSAHRVRQALLMQHEEAVARDEVRWAEEERWSVLSEDHRRVCVADQRQRDKLRIKKARWFEAFDAAIRKRLAGVVNDEAKHRAALVHSYEHLSSKLGKDMEASYTTIHVLFLTHEAARIGAMFRMAHKLEKNERSQRVELLAKEKFDFHSIVKHFERRKNDMLLARRRDKVQAQRKNQVMAAHSQKQRPSSSKSVNASSNSLLRTNSAHSRQKPPALSSSSLATKIVDSPESSYALPYEDVIAAFATSSRGSATEAEPPESLSATRHASVARTPAPPSPRKDYLPKRDRFVDRTAAVMRCEQHLRDRLGHQEASELNKLASIHYKAMAQYNAVTAEKEQLAEMKRAHRYHNVCVMLTRCQKSEHDVRREYARDELRELEGIRHREARERIELHRKEVLDETHCEMKLQQLEHRRNRITRAQNYVNNERRVHDADEPVHFDFQSASIEVAKAVQENSGMPAGLLVHETRWGSLAKTGEWKRPVPPGGHAATSSSYYQRQRTQREHADKHGANYYAKLVENRIDAMTPKPEDEPALDPDDKAVRDIYMQWQQVIAADAVDPMVASDP